MLAIKNLLFCPANATLKFEKALKSTSDIVIFDFEDAIPLSEKATTRTIFFKWFTQLPPSKSIGIRINSIRTKEGLADILNLTTLDSIPSVIMLPKVESSEEITIINSLLPSHQTKFIATIESPKGLNNSEAIATSPKVSALMLGSADLASELGCINSRETLQYASSRIVAASALANIACIDSPFFKLDEDDEALIEDSYLGKTLGFTARAAIHPKQLKAINETYTPTDKEIKEAQEIVKAIEKGIGIVNGNMVDEAMAIRARKIIASTNKSI